jgi:lauroyl/myristoyl acyltransferase
VISLLEGIALWAWYTVVALLLVILVVLTVLVPMFAVYGAIHVLARLYAAAHDGDREQARTRGTGGPRRSARGERG